MTAKETRELLQTLMETRPFLIEGAYYVKRLQPGREVPRSALCPCHLCGERAHYSAISNGAWTMRCSNPLCESFNY